MAEKLGISYKKYLRIETSDDQINTSVIVDITNKLGLSYTWLMGFDDTFAPTIKQGYIESVFEAIKDLEETISGKHYVTYEEIKGKQLVYNGYVFKEDFLTKVIPLCADLYFETNKIDHKVKIEEPVEVTKEQPIEPTKESPIELPKVQPKSIKNLSCDNCFWYRWNSSDDEYSCSKHLEQPKDKKPMYNNCYKQRPK